MSTAKTKNENLKALKSILKEPVKFFEENKHTGKPCVSQAYKKYGYFENWEIALSKLNDLPATQNVFNELIIRENGEVKPYFDIEYYYEHFDYQQEEVLLCIKNGLVKIFKDEWGYPLNPKDILTAECHRRTPRGYKISFHIIISTTNPMLVFKSNNEASGLANKLREYVMDKFDPSIIDTGVYKKVQNFRLMGHTKEGEDTPLTRMSGVDRNELDFLVTNIDHNNKKVLKSDEQTDSLWKSMMKIKGFSSIKPTEDQLGLVTEMCKIVHPTCYFEKMDDNGFIQYNYSDKSEQCFTGHYHDQIGFYVFIRDKQVYMGCHSGRCVDSVNERDVKKIKVIGKLEIDEPVKEILPVDIHEDFDIDYPLVTTCVFDRSFGIARLFKKMYMNPVRLKYTTEKKIYYWDGELWIEDESMFLDSLLVQTVVKILRRYLNSFFDEVQDICVIEPDQNDDIEKSRKQIINSTHFICNFFKL